jgi:glycosyltransferase involved in cell wall biosynthesis
MVNDKNLVEAQSVKNIEDLPRVSICIVSYNQVNYIKTCLDSLICHQFDISVEIIIGDDGSTDGTAEVIIEYARRFPKLIKAVLREVNIGPFENYREVHKMAMGDYIAHIDGDDYWLPGKIREQVMIMDNHTEAAAIFSNAIVIDEAGGIQGLFTKNTNKCIAFDELISRGNFLNHSSMMYRTCLRDKVIPKTGCFIDFNLYLTLAKHGVLLFINKPYVAYRLSSVNSLVKNKPDMVSLLYWNSLLENHRMKNDMAIRGMGYFWCGLAIRSINCHDFIGFFKWNVRIMRETQYHSIKIFAIGLFFLTRNAFNQVLLKLFSLMGVKVLRVYR